MITSQKCNCCVHDNICAFKEQYLKACEAVKQASYSMENNSFMMIKDSKINVNIGCPYMMTQTNYRDIAESQCPQY